MRRPLLIALGLVQGVLGCAENAAPTAGSIPAPEDSGAVAGTVSATATAAPSASAVGETTDLEERWGGRVETGPSAALEFIVRIRPGDAPTARMVIPAQNLPPTALTEVTHTPEAMSFTLALPGVPESAHARFSVARAPGDATAQGSLKQSGLTMPLSMRRLREGESFAEVKRPQTPLPPFPYDAREASYSGKDGTKLAGTLTVPRGGGRHPAVVLITGTGPQDRDETLAGHKFFLVIADAITRAGIAVLRVDNRGVGGSGGDTAQTGLDGKVDDALAGMAWLATQPDIDPARMGLLGHSEGGIIAPLAATRAESPSPSVAFVVMLAGPGVSGAALFRRQMADTLRAQGVTPERFRVGMAGQNKAIDAVLAGATDEAMRVIAEEIVDGVLALASESERKKLGIFGRTTMVAAAVAAVASPAMRAVIRSNPGPTLEKVRCPVLALGGTLDLQVPAEENIGAIRAALERGKNTDVTTEILPGLNHLFQPAKIGTTEEWGTIEITIDPAVLEKVTLWLRKRAGLESPPAAVP